MSYYKHKVHEGLVDENSSGSEHLDQAWYYKYIGSTN